MRLPLLCVVLLSLAACSGEGRIPAGPGGDGDGGLLGSQCDKTCREGALPVGDQCVGTEDYFRDFSWPNTFSLCATCHVTGGEADGTRFILKPEGAPDFIAQNIKIVTAAMKLEQGGQPLLILKPTLAVPHGGQRQLKEDSLALATMQETLSRLKKPVVCADDTPPPRPIAEGVELLDAFGTLYKASLQIAGRPPTAKEAASVDTDGLDALDAILKAQMKEPWFAERLREMFSDVLLTDGFRANNTSGSSSIILGSDQYPSAAVDYFGGPDWDWRSWPRGEGIRLVEALAREPVEFVVRAVANDEPLGSILTAKHRLLNAYSARFFKVAYKGFAPGTDFADIPNPEEYVPVTHLPGINEVNGSGEYAGILTTSAFLLRYPSSPTNFNRKRARFTYKYFLDFDIMKTVPRIDASAIDLSDYPTRKNPQCTGCHSKIDPLAGAYLNEDECGYSAEVFYQPPGSTKDRACDDHGWVPEDHMFAPGVGEGAERVLTLAQRPQALEVLAASIVSQKAFAAAIVRHIYTALMGRPPVQAPADPKQPGFANLDLAASTEAADLERLTSYFVAHEHKVPALIVEIVMSSAFRAFDADTAGRLELVAMGGGVLTTPENLNRKITAVTGVVWQGHGASVVRDTGYQRLGRHDHTQDAYLLLREELKTLYGGLDGSFSGTKTRQRQSSTMTAAIVEHMALEVACLATTRDFDRDPKSRRLFPKVEKSLTPSGKPSDAGQAPILDNIRYLHERILGERLSASDPEVLATYQVLADAHTEGLAQIAAGHESANLSRPCSSDIDIATGAVSAGTTNDPTYVLRAWQAVVAYLLMDYRFAFEH